MSRMSLFSTSEVFRIFISVPLMFVQAPGEGFRERIRAWISGPSSNFS